jgi:galactan endo-1,6-beta-galactosidase
MIRRRTLLAATAGGLLTGALAVRSAGANVASTVDPSRTYGTWEGWGTSLAWWANIFGARDEFADIFFTTNRTPYNGTSLPGLGLNIARYNLGASSWNSVDGKTMAASGDFPAFKQIEGYWQDWMSEDPASSSWKWTADANQRAMLVKATARGAISELFANSPMWWMCLNLNPSGAPDGGNNLQPWNYRQHASHLASVALYARQHWGVDFTTVEAFNEPSSPWWKATGSSEGCHMDPSIQTTVLAHLRSQLNKRGLTNTQIAASDETAYDLARATWNSFSSETKGYVNRINVHGYQPDGRRDLLYTDVVTTAGKGLWNSETGDNDGSGLTLAKNLLMDFRWLHPTAWVYWQVMDPASGWAMIAYDPNTLQSGAVQTKYYVMAQFSRHIRPGMTILDTGVDYAVAALDKSANRLVIVAANISSSAQTVSFDLSRFTTVTGGVNGLVPRWNTVTTGSSDLYTSHSDTYLSGKSLSVPFTAQSVQTLQVDGVAV